MSDQNSEYSSPPPPQKKRGMHSVFQKAKVIAAKPVFIQFRAPLYAQQLLTEKALNTLETNWFNMAKHLFQNTRKSPSPSNPLAPLASAIFLSQRRRVQIVFFYLFLADILHIYCYLSVYTSYFASCFFKVLQLRQC